jgi:hypothetical protein
MSMDLALFGVAVTLGPALTNIAQALIHFRSERERREFLERLAAEHGPGAASMLGKLIPPEPLTVPGSRRRAQGPVTK